MPTHDLELPVGAQFTLAYKFQTAGYATPTTYSDTALSAAYVMAVEEGEETSGTVDSVATSGSNDQLKDASFDEADDFWNGCAVEFTSGGNNGERRLVKDFAQTSGVFTLDTEHDPLPATPAAADSFAVIGYPIITRQEISQAGGVKSGASVAMPLTQANGVLAAPRIVRVVLEGEFTVTTAGETYTDRAFKHVLLNVLPRVQ